MPAVIRGTYSGGPAFSSLRRRAMLRDTAEESGEQLRELVRQNISKFSDTGALWKSVKVSEPKRVAPRIMQVKVYSEIEYAAAVEYGTSERRVMPRKHQAVKWWNGKTGEFNFSKGHIIGAFEGHHMFQKAAVVFERMYAEDIAEDNARIWLGTVDAGRKTVVF